MKMENVSYTVSIQDGRGYSKNKGKDFPGTGAGLKAAWTYAIESKTKRNKVQILEVSPAPAELRLLDPYKYTLVANVK